MLNYWWVTRPKRKLDSVPEVLAGFTEMMLNQAWDKERSTHLEFENILESSGLKRKGERRDQTGGGARTYKAWLVSLGLIFTQKITGNIQLTLAGEALLKGEPPVPVLRNQILKYQFPSSFSKSRGVRVSDRFKIHPFIFLLKLLSDNRINYLTEEEIAKIIITEAENESDECFEYIVKRIQDFRTYKDNCLKDDFFIKYKPSKGDVNPEHPFSHLMDIANTMVNWLEYTQYVIRDNGAVQILSDRYQEVDKILSQKYPFIDRPDEHEYFQRKYGVDLKHKKDNRNFSDEITITPQVIVKNKVIRAYITLTLKQPVTVINQEIIDVIAETTGIKEIIVEEILHKNYPYGSIGAFMTRYFEMAFKGREDATEFEKATCQIFQDVFKFRTKHTGPIGLTPDVLIASDEEQYQAIIDNKAYSEYTISNDHHNRMVYNYIENISHYSSEPYPLVFFTYISGGFGKNINQQIQKIYYDSGVRGSAISVTQMIKMIEQNHYSHADFKQLFTLNRQIYSKDII